MSSCGTLKTLLIAGVVALLVFGASAYSKQPSHDKNWEVYHSKTPAATISDTDIVLENVRNWNHNREEVLSQEWLPAVSIDPTTVTEVWFGFSNFSDSRYVGHTFLSFVLDDGSAYTLSIEARREVGEEYTALKGLFNQYELLYGWGTERDYVGVRLFMLNQQVEMYQLVLTPAEAQAVFIVLAERTNRLAKKPAFYNTLTSNCTNELVSAINQKYPDSLPYGLAHNLPGLSINYLRGQGLITIENRSVISPDTPELIATITQTPSEFSRTLRNQLADQ